MIRLSKMTDYGLVILMHMAKEPNQRAKANQLAEGLRLPLPTVGRLLKQLQRESFLISKRGLEGGYTLSRPPENITLLEIFTALEGGMSLTDCCDEPVDCQIMDTCTAIQPLRAINNLFRKILSEMTLQAIVREAA